LFELSGLSSAALCLITQKHCVRFMMDAPAVPSSRAQARARLPFKQPSALTAGPADAAVSAASDATSLQDQLSAAKKVGEQHKELCDAPYQSYMPSQHTSHDSRLAGQLSFACCAMHLRRRRMESQHIMGKLHPAWQGLPQGLSSCQCCAQASPKQLQEPHHQQQQQQDHM
jgi:hypothetical protein